MIFFYLEANPHKFSTRWYNFLQYGQVSSPNKNNDEQISVLQKKIFIDYIGRQQRPNKKDLEKPQRLHSTRSNYT